MALSEGEAVVAFSEEEAVVVASEGEEVVVDFEEETVIEETPRTTAVLRIHRVLPKFYKYIVKTELVHFHVGRPTRYWFQE